MKDLPDNPQFSAKQHGDCLSCWLLAVSRSYLVGTLMIYFLHMSLGFQSFMVFKIQHMGLDRDGDKSTSWLRERNSEDFLVFIFSFIYISFVFIVNNNFIII